MHQNNTSSTNSKVNTQTIRKMDSDALYGKWAISIPGITRTMREMAGAPWNGSMAVFTKDSGLEAFSKAWV